MFNFLFNNKGEEEMARSKTSKTAKIRNLFNTVVMLLENSKEQI